MSSEAELKPQVPVQPKVLNVGILQMNRSHLYSPNNATPELFTAPIEYGEATERGAHRLLGRYGIAVSSYYMLRTHEAGDQGYVLRESRNTDLAEHQLTPFNRTEILEYLRSIESHEPRHHFLVQIAHLMK